MLFNSSSAPGLLGILRTYIIQDDLSRTSNYYLYTCCAVHTNTDSTPWYQCLLSKMALTVLSLQYIVVLYTIDCQVLTRHSTIAHGENETNQSSSHSQRRSQRSLCQTFHILENKSIWTRTGAGPGKNAPFLRFASSLPNIWIELTLYSKSPLSDCMDIPRGLISTSPVEPPWTNMVRCSIEWH